MKKIIFFVLAIVLLFPLAVSARIGVGVAIGRIEIDKPLKPGGVYELTPLVVLNTGDEPADYEITVAYHSEQPQFRPAQEWFSFNPSPFHLEPGKSQNIAVKLTLPVETKPGDYFAYLQGQPLKKITATGGTSIGVAAATKLYFTVIPANIWQGIYYRIISFWVMYSPWTWVVLAIIVGAIFIALFRKFFKFQIGISRK
jgi:P pilus assembly chaperone PapD